MTNLSRCSHPDVGEAFIRLTLPTSNRTLMLRIQSMHSVAMRASTVKAVVSALKMRFCGCKGEKLSLTTALMAIAIGSLAFWLSQPAHLFNGGASPPASAIVTPLNRPSSPITHGLLSLELLAAMQHHSPRLMHHRWISGNKHCELNGSKATSLISHDFRVLSACPRRATAR
ncbi:hypothetical protein [Paraburkholderia sp. GAS348]|uniref:hypothetical protein n=1 Tax=Paraburkholderia sp. GAS348 TaxID=3035132 RepID=UPI003D1BB925